MIAPSAVLINGTREFFGNKLEKAVEVIQIGQLIQRELVLSDLTRTIAWLISDAISFVTAETISIDGGTVML